MFALVESGSITKMLNGNRGITIDGVQHPRTIYTLWTEAERNAIGIYEITIDTSKKKDEQWYINTNITYAFSGGKVTGSYGDATAKAHADTKWTQSEIDAGKAPEGADTNTVKEEGLKTVLIRQVKKQTESELNKTDWYITRKSEKDTAIPSSITTHRDAVRAKQASMETQITNASDTPALETLYTYTEQEDGSVTRPIGNIPTLEV
mgnify:FL=1|tara:strand:- start:878 stop:1498 length:621 start_codon:yes stop_codon:yes gene_type:complete